MRELCAPFGRLVQSKLNVGANKNQAFVEFPDQTSAINMVSYFASSADPAKVCDLRARMSWVSIVKLVVNFSVFYRTEHFVSLSVHNSARENVCFF